VVTKRQEAISTIIGYASSLSCEFDISYVEHKEARDRVTEALINLGVQQSEIENTEEWQAFLKQSW
jgi:hypothetical protein